MRLMKNVRLTLASLSVIRKLFPPANSSEFASLSPACGRDRLCNSFLNRQINFTVALKFF